MVLCGKRHSKTRPKRSHKRGFTQQFVHHNSIPTQLNPNTTHNRTHNKATHQTITASFKLHILASLTMDFAEGEKESASVKENTHSPTRRVSKLRPVLCYICCAEFGLTSMRMHQETCLKEHMWCVFAYMCMDG